MTALAYRGLGRLLLSVGVVLALTGAARIEKSGDTWTSRPVWRLFGGGISLLLVSVGLLRRFGGAAHAAGGGDSGAGDTAVQVAELLSGLRRIHAGQPADFPDPDAGTGGSSSQSASKVSARSLPLELLVSSQAPAESADDNAYLLWLKLQLDPIVDRIYPEIIAGRERFRSRYGLSAFAKVYSGLARGERLVLRSWSAAVDGYPSEAKAALQNALAQIEESTTLLKEMGNST